MGTFILFLLLIAAVFGVLGAVLKVALVLVLSAILATVLLAAIGIWWARARLNAVQRELEHRAQMERRRREAYDVNVARDEHPRGPTRDLGAGD